MSLLLLVLREEKAVEVNDVNEAAAAIAARLQKTTASLTSFGVNANSLTI